MNVVASSTGGLPITLQVAMKFEDALQAFAVRSACFIGELGVPFAEEFDSHDYAATHVIASCGDEPIGAVRVRWFGSFAMVERLSVLQRFRRRGVGELLLGHCRSLARSRHCPVLYAAVLPSELGYLLKQGWRRLTPVEQSGLAPSRIVITAIAVDEGRPLSVSEMPEAIALQGKA